MKYGLRLDIFLKNIVGQNHRAIFGHLLWQMVVYLHYIDFFLFCSRAVKISIAA